LEGQGRNTKKKKETTLFRVSMRGHSKRGCSTTIQEGGGGFEEKKNDDWRLEHQKMARIGMVKVGSN